MGPGQCTRLDTWDQHCSQQGFLAPVPEVQAHFYRGQQRAEEEGLWPSTGTGDRERPNPLPPDNTVSPEQEGPPPPWCPRQQCTLGAPTPPGSCPAWFDISVYEGPGGAGGGVPREAPTCLVHHGGEGGLDGRLAPLCRPDMMVRPVLGRSQNLKELCREHGFDVDVLEGEAGR